MCWTKPTFWAWLFFVTSSILPLGFLNPRLSWMAAPRKLNPNTIHWSKGSIRSKIWLRLICWDPVVLDAQIQGKECGKLRNLFSHLTLNLCKWWPVYHQTSKFVSQQLGTRRVKATFKYHPQKYLHLHLYRTSSAALLLREEYLQGCLAVPFFTSIFTFYCFLFLCISHILFYKIGLLLH